MEDWRALKSEYGNAPRRCSVAGGTMSGALRMVSMGEGRVAGGWARPGADLEAAAMPQLSPQLGSALNGDTAE